MDPLSDVLSLLKPRSYMCGGFDMGGEWSIRFPQHEGIKCYALVSGRCWLSVEGVPDAVRLQPGDCFLLPSGRPFRLASDLTLTPADAHTMFSFPLNGGIASCNGGGDCFGVGGYFAFTGDHAGILLGVLPPIVHIRKESDKEAMRWSLERMMQELREPQPGGFLVAQQLAYMMLVQALRLHLAEGCLLYTSPRPFLIVLRIQKTHHCLQDVDGFWRVDRLAPTPRRQAIEKTLELPLPPLPHPSLEIRLEQLNDVVLRGSQAASRRIPSGLFQRHRNPLHPFPVFPRCGGN